VGAPPPEDPPALWESFLHSAQFVGRKRELDILTGALKAILPPSVPDQPPTGSLWLVGGESGVGKSRLLEELRTYAMVKGVMVLRGQAVAEGGLPYQLLREPLRRVLLSTPVDNLEAAVLRDTFSELNLPIANHPVVMPRLDGKASLERLTHVVMNVLRRACAQQPILVLLEDLHWSDHLPILKAMQDSLARLPLMIVGSYRPEERPDLPAEFPFAHTLMLSRLNTEEITALSVAMLGEVGSTPHVLDLLKRETEGNAFFLVEVVRALAEDTGRLEDIGSMTLPAHVFTGGVRTIIAERLARVPAEGQKLLQLAAVAGRALDLHLMRRLAEKTAISLDDWLTACANAAVLELTDDTWRFSHDKFREYALTAIPMNLQRRLHREVAEALEMLYPDAPEKAAALAHHWHIIEDAPNELRYAMRAGDYAERVGIYPEAVVHLQRALLLALSDDYATRAGLMLKLGAAYNQLADYPRATEYLMNALRYARLLNLSRTQADAMLLLSTVLWRLGSNAEARLYAEQCLALCREIRYRRGIVLALNRLGMIAFAMELLQEALVLARDLDDPSVLLLVLNNNGVRARVLGDYEGAQTYHEEQAALARQVGSQGDLAYALNNLAHIASVQADFARAQQFADEAIALHRSLGQRAPLVDALMLLGTIHLFCHRYDEAQQRLDEAAKLAAGIGYRSGLLEAKGYLGDLAYARGDLLTAEDQYSIYLAESLDMGDGNHAGAAAVGLAHVARRTGDMPRARRLYRQAVKLMPRRVEPFLAHVVIGFAGTLDDTQIERALAWLGLALHVPSLDIAPRREGGSILHEVRTRAESILSSQQIAQAMAHGGSLDLNAIIDDLLESGE
jgi:predicted ATPase